MAAPVLKLQDETTTDRQYLTFGDKAYDFRGRHELGVKEEIFCERHMGRLGELLEKAGNHEVTDDENDELKRLLDRMVAMAIIAPPEVLARFTYYQRVQICQVFLPLLFPKGRTTAATPTPARRSPSTGKRSSRGSSGSTAATRSRGSSASRSI